MLYNQATSATGCAITHMMGDLIGDFQTVELVQIYLSI